MLQQDAVGFGEFLLGESVEQETLEPRGLPHEVDDVDDGFDAGGVPDADQDAAFSKRAERLTGGVAAEAVVMPESYPRGALLIGHIQVAAKPLERNLPDLLSNI